MISEIVITPVEHGWIVSISNEVGSIRWAAETIERVFAIVGELIRESSPVADADSKGAA